MKAIEPKKTKKPQKRATANAATKVQFSKDAKLIPNMVYHMEKFDQFVIALSKKVEVRHIL